MGLVTAELNDQLAHLTGKVGQLSLHSADPGTNGANETTAARKTPTFNAPANGSTDLAAQVDFTGGAANGAVTHVGLWHADGTTFMGSYALSGDASFNAAGEYSVTSLALSDANG